MLARGAMVWAFGSAPVPRAAMPRWTTSSVPNSPRVTLAISPADRRGRSSPPHPGASPAGSRRAAVAPEEQRGLGAGDGQACPAHLGEPALTRAVFVGFQKCLYQSAGGFA